MDAWHYRDAGEISADEGDRTHSLNEADTQDDNENGDESGDLSSVVFLLSRTITIIISGDNDDNEDNGDNDCHSPIGTCW